MVERRLKTISMGELKSNRIKLDRCDPHLSLPSRSRDILFQTRQKGRHDLNFYWQPSS